MDVRNRPGPPLMQSYVVATAILAGAIFIAGAIAAVGLEDSDKGDKTAAPVATSTTVPTTTRPPTGGVIGPAPTTTMAPPPTTTTTIRSGSTATTTPATAAPACGKGSVEAAPRVGPVEPDDNGIYQIPRRAKVTSNLNKPIEVTDLTLRIRFDDGSSTLVKLGTAGVTIAAGASHTFDDGPLESGKAPVQIDVVSFAYQTAGRPDCAVSI